MAQIEKLVVVGVGLIGGSFALALKAANAVGHVIGVGRHRANLEQAIARGVIDRAEHDVAQAIDSADLVFVATPVGSMPALFERMARTLEPNTLITDGGSTKQSVIDAARAGLGAKLNQFIPSHPIAGSEKSGVAAASSELYRGHEVILTPVAENLPADVERIRQYWQQCGARVGVMDPQRHDSVLAAISHLPHFIAFSYMETMAGRGDAADVLTHAGSGFRDFTRLAASHPQMWADICTANRQPLLNELERFESALKDLRALIESGDSAAIERRFAAARAMRERWAATFGVSPAEGE